MTDTPTEAPFDPIASRQDEVAQYDAAIAMYQSVAATLPSEWPAHLAQFKSRTDTHQAITEIEDLDDVALVSQLWAHDQAQGDGADGHTQHGGHIRPHLGRGDPQHRERGAPQRGHDEQLDEVAGFHGVMGVRGAESARG